MDKPIPAMPNTASAVDNWMTQSARPAGCFGQRALSPRPGTPTSALDNIASHISKEFEIRPFTS
jgi:hypothetical protein